MVLASGDLTDSKDYLSFGSRQYEFEWKTYSEILNESNIRDRTLWMDIRGNHGKGSIIIINKEGETILFVSYAATTAIFSRTSRPNGTRQAEPN